VPAHLFVRVKLMVESLSLHDQHDQALGYHTHYARTAALHLAGLHGQEVPQRALAVHRQANFAKHNGAVKDASVDKLQIFDPWRGAKWTNAPSNCYILNNSSADPWQQYFANVSKYPSHMLGRSGPATSVDVSKLLLRLDRIEALVQPLFHHRWPSVCSNTDALGVAPSKTHERAVELPAPCTADRDHEALFIEASLPHHTDAEPVSFRAMGENMCEAPSIAAEHTAAVSLQVPSAAEESTAAAELQCKSNATAELLIKLVESTAAAELQIKSNATAELLNKLEESTAAAELQNKSNDTAELSYKLEESTADAELQNKLEVSTAAAELLNKSNATAELPNKLEESTAAAELQNKSNDTAELQFKLEESAAAAEMQVSALFSEMHGKMEKLNAKMDKMHDKMEKAIQ